MTNPDATATFSELIRQQAFLRYWCARIAATAGAQMLMVVVGWEMYSLTNSAWDLGLVGLYQFLPALLLTLPAGHLADHVNRRLIFSVTSASWGGTAVLLVISSHQHWLSRELLLGVSILMGTIRAFQMPAQQSLMPQLVPLRLLPRATAFSSGGAQAAIIVGPALGGIIYLLGATTVYSVCAILFTLACAFLLSVKYNPTIHPTEPATLKTVFAGVSFIWKHKVLLGAVSLDLFAVLLGGAVALLPIYAKDILHVGPVGLGMLRSAPAVGALAMSILLARWPLGHHVGKILLYAVAVYGLCMVIFGSSTYFVVSLLALMVSGMADMVSVVIRLSLVALETPDAMRGRVSAVNSIFIGASNQLGEFESGATAAWFGPVGAVVLGGIGTLLIAASWVKLFPPLARRDTLNKTKLENVQ